MVDEHRRGAGRKAGSGKTLRSSLPLAPIALLDIVGLACAWSLDPAEPLKALVSFGDVRIDSVLLAAAFVIAALFSRRLDFWIENVRIARMLCICGALGGVAGIASHAAEPNGAIAAALAVVSCALLMAFQCYFMLRGVIRISRLGMMKSLFSLALWQILIGVASLSDAFFSPTALFLTVLAGGIAANAAATGRRQGEPQANSSVSSLGRGNPFAPPWRILAAQLLMLFSIHAFRVLLGSGVQEYTAVGFISAAFIVAGVAGARQKIFALRTYYNISLLLIEAAFLLFAFLPACFAIAAGILADASYVFFAILTFTVYGTMCQRFDISPCATFGLAFAMECVGNALGGLFGPLCQNLGIDSVHALLALTFIPLACFTCFFRERDFRTSWGIREKESDRLNVVRYYTSMADRCSALARQNGLSRREEDVLLMLAQRKTAQGIADELYISVPTVKTHTQHIYQKLDVHSRKELLAAIGYPAPGIDSAQDRPDE